MSKLRYVSRVILPLAIAALAISPANSQAETTVVNLNSVSVPNGGQVDATALLASYGITVVDGGNPVYIYSDVDQSYEAASPGPNFLLQQVPGAPNGISYTLDFSTPLSELSFARIAATSPNLMASWTATAYSGVTAVGTASEPFGLQPFSAEVYSFTGPDITSLTISANGYDLAGITSAPIDDITLTTVPEGGSTRALTLFSLLALGVGARRIKPISA
jgi:hypothetical protein